MAQFGHFALLKKVWLCILVSSTCVHCSLSLKDETKVPCLQSYTMFIFMAGVFDNHIAVFLLFNDINPSSKTIDDALCRNHLLL